MIHAMRQRRRRLSLCERSALNGAWPSSPARRRSMLSEMRASGLRRLLVGCGDYKCAHHVEISAKRWSDDVWLSEFFLLTCEEKGGV